MTETIVNRNEIFEDTYREILAAETHHDHVIIKDEQGTLRWKENPRVINILKKISLDDLCPLLRCLGYGKNSEVYRQLYRDMGYSLFGYWEIFYWKTNNEQAEEYSPREIISKYMKMNLRPHDKFITQIKFSIMLKEFVNIPYWRFLKRFKKWKQVNRFASEHEQCCEIKW